VLGLGALLGSLGDTAGAAVCSRAAIAIGVLWLTAIVATTATNAVAMLIGDDRRCRPRGGPRRRRRRRRDGGLYEGLPRERRPLEAEPGDRRG
jgi:hypothetical protein